MIHKGIDILDLSLRINWLSRRHPQTQTSIILCTIKPGLLMASDTFDDRISIDWDDPLGFSVSFSDVATWQVGLPLHLAISASGRDLRRGSGTWKLNPCRLELSVYDFNFRDVLKRKNWTNIYKNCKLNDFRDASFIQFYSFCSWITLDFFACFAERGPGATIWIWPFEHLSWG